MSATGSPPASGPSFAKPTDTCSGIAGDILGEATGQSLGNAFNRYYRMDLPVDDDSHEVIFDDWIRAFDEKTLLTAPLPERRDFHGAVRMNRSTIRKFGSTFAEVTIFMQKTPAFRASVRFDVPERSAFPESIEKPGVPARSWPPCAFGAAVETRHGIGPRGVSIPNRASTPGF